MRKSLGNKRNYLTDENIREITLVYGDFEHKGISKIFDTQDFGFRKITIDRPPASGKTVKIKKGQKSYDPDLRDIENVPLKEDIYQYFEREVKPHLPDAWINEEIRDEKDGKVGKVGYEINFNRYFYVYNPPRPLEEIRSEILEAGVPALFVPFERALDSQDRRIDRLVKDGMGLKAQVSDAESFEKSIESFLASRAEIRSMLHRQPSGPFHGAENSGKEILELGHQR